VAGIPGIPADIGSSYPDAPKYYGFTEWAIQLNEITSDIKDCLPPTDSRLRPDQRALEEGDVDAAEHGKQALEQKQRERRKRWEKVPAEARPPQFFRNDGDGHWRYAGDYCRSEVPGATFMRLTVLIRAHRGKTGEEAVEERDPHL